MDELLTARLEKSKAIREKLIKDGYHLPIPWVDVERAMIANHNKQREAPKVLEWDKLGRNDPCLCGSGKKYKKCCILKQK